MSLTPKDIPVGAVRYNTDSNKMEVYIGDTWMEVAVSSPNLDGGARGIAAGGNPGQNTINFFTISTQGDAQDFGDLTQNATLCSTGGSHVRALTLIGTTSHKNSIEFITISSTGNALDFGDIGGTNRRNVSATGSRTRMLICGGVYGSNPYSYKNEIDFVTISQTGNSQDFGDLTLGRTNPFAMSSPTRSVLGGGYYGSSPNGTNILDFVTIASTGNAQDFGDLIEAQNARSASYSNSTRGLTFGGRNISNTTLSRIEKIEIASKGNSTKFGDLTENVRFASVHLVKQEELESLVMKSRNADQSTMITFRLQLREMVFIWKFRKIDSFNGTSTSNDHGGL